MRKKEDGYVLRSIWELIQSLSPFDLSILEHEGTRHDVGFVELEGVIGSGGEGMVTVHRVMLTMKNASLQESERGLGLQQKGFYLVNGDDG